MKNLITGVVIEVLNKEHGQLVKNTFLQTFAHDKEVVARINRRGFDATRQSQDTLRFYGIDKEGNFDNYSQYHVNSEELKIVTLPEFSIMAMEALIKELRNVSGIDMTPIFSAIIDKIKEKISQTDKNLSKQEEKPAFSDYKLDLIEKVKQGCGIKIDGLEISNSKAKELSWNLEDKYYELGSVPAGLVSDNNCEAVQEQEAPKLPVYRPFETVEEARVYLGHIIYGKYEENDRNIYESSQIISTVVLQNGHLLINGIPAMELVEYFVFENTGNSVGILVS